MNVKQAAALIGVSGSKVYSLADRVKSLLSYNDVTGEFSRIAKIRGRESTWGIGTVEKNGYRRIAIDGRRYLAHRLAWVYVNGVLPSGNLDHINGNRLDNRILNLREATQSENLRNKKRTQKVHDYLKGAKFVPITGKWTAKIVCDSKVHHLGTFKSEIDAHKAYVFAAKEMHKDFAKFT